MSSKDYKDKIFVSEYNQYDEVLKKVNIPEKITIYDTTLRDGEQTPGVSFSLEQKLDIDNGINSLPIVE